MWKILLVLAAGIAYDIKTMRISNPAEFGKEESMKKQYEVMYIIRPNVEGEEVKNIVDRINNIFTSRNSDVVELKEMGLKDLAYEIDHHNKGYYVWLLVDATQEAINEFNRLIRINEQVIRFIVVKAGE